MLTAVCTLAQRVVSPGSNYNVDQQTWDKAMANLVAGDNYDLQTAYDTKQKYPRQSYEGAYATWTAAIRVASDVPTKDPALFQAGTALYFTPPADSVSTSDTDNSNQWYMCVHVLRVNKGSQGSHDETCFTQLGFECRANMSSATNSAFDWKNGTASSPCNSFELPRTCDGQVNPEHYVVGKILHTYVSSTDFPGWPESKAS